MDLLRNILKIIKYFRKIALLFYELQVFYADKMDIFNGPKPHSVLED